jgi:hypothetical protein
MRTAAVNSPEAELASPDTGSRIRPGGHRDRHTALLPSKSGVFAWEVRANNNVALS